MSELPAPHLYAPDTVEPEHAWMLLAKCSGEDTEDWFREWTSRAEARRLCAGCPVKNDCLEWALTTDSRFGVFGGLSEHDRDLLHRHRNGAL